MNLSLQARNCHSHKQRRRLMLRPSIDRLGSWCMTLRLHLNKSRFHMQCSRLSQRSNNDPQRRRPCTLRGTSPQSQSHRRGLRRSSCKTTMRQESIFLHHIMSAKKVPSMRKKSPHHTASTLFEPLQGYIVQQGMRYTLCSLGMCLRCSSRMSQQLLLRIDLEGSSCSS